jgi:signal peptidase I
MRYYIMLTASMSVNDIPGSKSALSEIVLDAVLAHGALIRVKGRGGSMFPFVRTGDVLLIEPKKAEELKIGDLVLYRRRSSGPHVMHRLIKRMPSGILILKGDSLRHFDPPVPAGQVLGRVISIERNGRSHNLNSPVNKITGVILAKLSPMSRWIYPTIRPFWRIYLVFSPQRTNVS